MPKKYYKKFKFRSINHKKKAILDTISRSTLSKTTKRESRQRRQRHWPRRWPCKLRKQIDWFKKCQMSSRVNSLRSISNK